MPCPFNYIISSSPGHYPCINCFPEKEGISQWLDHVIDFGNKSAKHLGQIADTMTEWEGKIAEELQLTVSDVAAIKTKHPMDLKLQTYGIQCMEPSNKRHFGITGPRASVLYSEVVLWWEFQHILLLILLPHKALRHLPSMYCIKSR